MITFLQSYAYRENRTMVSHVSLFKSGKGGFSTLEMLIAMSVMTMVLTGVVLTSFGNQSMLQGGEMNAEAMNMAQELLEQSQLLARKDFRLVVPIATTTDGVYKKSLWVDEWPGELYATKRVSAFISWVDDHQNPQSLTLTTLLSNFTDAVGGDTCYSQVAGNWSAPVLSAYELTAGDLLPGSMSGTYTVADIDAHHGMLYVSADHTSAPGLPTFFVFDIATPPQKPTYVGSTDTAPSLSSGPIDLQVGNIVEDASHVQRRYMYAAQSHAANFDTCAAGANCAQLQVIDVTDPAHPSVVFNFKFATSSASVPAVAPPYVNGSGGQAVGQALFYKDGYVYLGLSKTGSGNEFQIIDVRNPLNPVAIGNGFPVGRSIQSIFVRGKYAYISTDDTSKELMVLDITDPVDPKALTQPVYNPGGSNGGSKVFSIGDTLYFTKQYAGGSPELYVLDITNPGISGVPLVSAPLPNTKTIGASIRGLIIRDTLGFVLTSTTQQLQIFDRTNLAAAPVVRTVPGGVGGEGRALECERNTLYVGSNSGSAGFISVVKPGN